MFRKVKSQEVDICICGILENYGEILDSGETDAKTMRDGAFKMNNCAKFIRTHFRDNLFLLLRTLDQLMDSFIKPIIPKEELLGDFRRSNQHAVGMLHKSARPMLNHFDIANKVNLKMKLVPLWNLISELAMFESLPPGHHGIIVQWGLQK